MGVSSLWSLLAPCGRRCSVNTLERKRLAVDVSIWLMQFIKAMRDDSGEMVRNAPLLGLFRRLTKLLYLHIRPVLVFDGATPALKRRTVARRHAFPPSFSYVWNISHFLELSCLSMYSPTFTINGHAWKIYIFQ